MNNLNSFIDEMEKYRDNSIHTYEYTYLTKLIYNNEQNNKYGHSRDGFENYRNTESGHVTHSGEISLRIRKDNNGNDLEYILEKKVNTGYVTKILKPIFEKAKLEFYKLLDVKDIKTMDFWLEKTEDDSLSTLRSETVYYIARVKNMNKILYKYSTDNEFKDFLDKLKN